MRLDCKSASKALLMSPSVDLPLFRSFVVGMSLVTRGLLPSSLRVALPCCMAVMSPVSEMSTFQVCVRCGVLVPEHSRYCAGCLPGTQKEAGQLRSRINSERNFSYIRRTITTLNKSKGHGALGASH